MVDLIETQDIVFARLKSSTRIPSVFEGAVPAGVTLPKMNGVILPYIIVSFGGMSPQANRNKGITNSKDDVKWTSVNVEAIGASQRDARVVAHEVRKLLEGYSPDPSWGELEEILSGDYAVRVPDYDLSPVRYAVGVVFNVVANAASLY